MRFPVTHSYLITMGCCIGGDMTDKGDDVIYRAAENFDFTDSFWGDLLCRTKKIVGFSDCLALECWITEMLKSC